MSEKYYREKISNAIRDAARNRSTNDIVSSEEFSPGTIRKRKRPNNREASVYSPEYDDDTTIATKPIMSFSTTPIHNRSMRSERIGKVTSQIEGYHVGNVLLHPQKDAARATTKPLMHSIHEPIRSQNNHLLNHTNDTSRLQDFLGSCTTSLNPMEGRIELPDELLSEARHVYELLEITEQATSSANLSSTWNHVGQGSSVNAEEILQLKDNGLETKPSRNHPVAYLRINEAKDEHVKQSSSDEFDQEIDKTLGPRKDSDQIKNMNLEQQVSLFSDIEDETLLQRHKRGI
jgi:hypothetical protein